MHSLAHHHGGSDEASVQETKGAVLNWGWRYDLGEWFADHILFRGKLRGLRQKTIDLASIQPGDKVLDVGCGTGTLAIMAQERVGAAGHVYGIDPGTSQISRAKSKAARRNLPIDFRVGVIEHLPFPDQSLDVVFSTIMMHHLPDDVKRQGLAEISRVLKPTGRLVIADFIGLDDHHGEPARHGAGQSSEDLPALVKDAGFSLAPTETVTLRIPIHAGMTSVGFIRAQKA